MLWLVAESAVSFLSAYHAHIKRTIWLYHGKSRQLQCLVGAQSPPEIQTSRLSCITHSQTGCRGGHVTKCPQVTWHDAITNLISDGRWRSQESVHCTTDTGCACSVNSRCQSFVLNTCHVELRPVSICWSCPNSCRPTSQFTSIFDRSTAPPWRTGIGIYTPR